MIVFTPHTADGLEHVHANGQHIVTLLELGSDRLRQMIDSMKEKYPAFADLRDWDLIVSAIDIAIDKAEAVEKAGWAFWQEWDRDQGVSDEAVTSQCRAGDRRAA